MGYLSCPWKVRVWTVSADGVMATEAQTFTSHEVNPYAWQVSWSMDGRHLAVCAADTTVRIYTYADAEAEQFDLDTGVQVILLLYYIMRAHIHI